jgi:hypothetical protein
MEPPPWEERQTWVGRTIQFINPDGSWDPEHYLCTELRNGTLYELSPLHKPTAFPRIAMLHTKDFAFVDGKDKEDECHHHQLVPPTSITLPEQIVTTATSSSSITTAADEKITREDKGQLLRSTTTTGSNHNNDTTTKKKRAAKKNPPTPSPTLKKKKCSKDNGRDALALLAAQQDAVGRPVSVYIDDKYEPGTITKFQKSTGKHGILLADATRPKYFDLGCPDLTWHFTDLVKGKVAPRHSVKTSRFIGVRRRAANRWDSYGIKNTYLGFYPTEEAAALAYDDYVRKKWPNSNWPLNFPKDEEVNKEMVPKYKGVVECKSNHHMGTVYKAKYGTKVLGTFPTPGQAAMAYDVEAGRRNKNNVLNFGHRTIDPNLVALLQSIFQAKSNGSRSDPTLAGTIGVPTDESPSVPFPKYRNGTRVFVVGNKNLTEGLYMLKAVTHLD